MSLVDALYPQHRPPSREAYPAGPQPVTLIVCLPPDVRRHFVLVVADLIERLRPHVALPTGLLGGHFPLWRQPDATESALLVLAQPMPDTPGMIWCAGGPVGLLDLAGTAARLRAQAPRDLDDWHTIVAGTEPATAWWHYLDAHHADPDGYPLDRALAEFAAQPRVAAMADHNDRAAGSEVWYPADMYGPGLEALHAGVDELADYQAGLVAFADGLVTLDGQLLIPSFTPVLVEQTLAERQVYHDRARRYVAGLDPTTLLVAARTAR